MIASVSNNHTTFGPVPAPSAGTCPACSASVCSCSATPAANPAPAKVGLAANDTPDGQTTGITPAAPSSHSSAQQPAPPVGREADLLAITVAEQEAIKELQERDQEVRTHEQAHVSAGGRYVTGGASYTYETGPDNRQYATGGEVRLDVAPVPGDPDATMEKARTVRRAALAPAQPSSQDQQVAAQASLMEAEAQLEKTRQRDEQPTVQGREEAKASLEASEPELDAKTAKPLSIIEEMEHLREEKDPGREPGYQSEGDTSRALRAYTQTADHRQPSRFENWA